MTGAVAAAVAAAAPFAATLHTFNSNGVNTETIPTGATQVVIEAWGPSGNGGTGFSNGCIFRAGGGGGSGGYCKTVLALTPTNWGQTISVTAPLATTSDTQVAAGTFAMTTMNPLHGTAGGNASSGVNGTNGVGGTASGGNTTNTSGNNGAGGVICTGGSGGAGVVGVNGTGGTGGTGGVGNTNSGRTLGVGGLVLFAYT